MKFRFVYACRKTEKQKICFKLKHGIKSRWLQFSPYDEDPMNSRLFFMWPLVDTEFDMPGLHNAVD
jgi:hypothetical protein